MFISRIKLTNWKNFTSIDVSLSERTFIIDPNAVGKSNLLDVFRFLRDIARDGGGLQEAVKQRGGLSKIRCLYARAPRTDVEIELYISEKEGTEPLWQYALGLTQKGGGVVGETRAVLRFEKVRKNNILILDRPEKNDEEDEELKQYTHLEQPTSNAQFRELADFFKSIDYQHIIPQLIRDPLSFQKTGSREDFYGRDLFEKMSRMAKRTKDSQLKKS